MKGAEKDGPHHLVNHAGVSKPKKQKAELTFYLPLPNSKRAVGLLAGWGPFGSFRNRRPQLPFFGSV